MSYHNISYYMLSPPRGGLAIPYHTIPYHTTLYYTTLYYTTLYYTILYYNVLYHTGLQARSPSAACRRGLPKGLRPRGAWEGARVISCFMNLYVWAFLGLFLFY